MPGGKFMQPVKTNCRTLGFCRGPSYSSSARSAFVMDRSFGRCLRPDRRDTGRPVNVRFIAIRKPESAANQSREQVRRRTRDKGMTPVPHSFIAADFMLVVTSLPRDEYPPERVLALYRIHWQVELAFKRLKSLLHLGRLPAKDNALARSWIYAHLIAALLIDDMTQDLLDSPPSTQVNGEATAVSLAGLQDTRGHQTQRYSRLN